MKLDSLYNLDEKEILNYLDNNSKNNTRYEGYRYKVIDNDIHLLGWQYTKINFPNNNINIYIFLKLIIDQNLNIKYINLYDNFKGSQGFKCNRDYLNKHINKIFINEKLSLDNPKIKDYKLSYCRHIYEILYGLCDFVQINKKEKDSFYFESTKINIGFMSINLESFVNLNNKKYNLSTSIKNINRIRLNKSYQIVNSNNISLISYFNHKEILNTKISSSNATEFYQNTLKNIFKIYTKINTNMSLDNNLSFSIYFPTSLYSFLVQLITVYKRFWNQKALKKCLNNFQIINGKALCLGFEGDKDDNI